MSSYQAKTVTMFLDGAQRLWTYFRRRCLPLVLCEYALGAARRRRHWDLIGLTVLAAGLAALEPVMSHLFGPWRWVIVLGAAQFPYMAVLGGLLSLQRLAWDFTLQQCGRRADSLAGTAQLASKTGSL